MKNIGLFTLAVFSDNDLHHVRWLFGAPHDTEVSKYELLSTPTGVRFDRVAVVLPSTWLPAGQGQRQFDRWLLEYVHARILGGPDHQRLLVLRR